MLAALRPDAWDAPVFAHVLGAAIYAGALVTAAAALATTGRREGDAERLTKIGLWSLAAAIPAWVVTRVAGEWSRSRAGWDPDASWLTVGYVVSDLGAVVLVLSIVLAAAALRSEARRGLARVAGGLAALVLVGTLVAVWAMVAKPG